MSASSIAPPEIDEENGKWCPRRDGILWTNFPIGHPGQSRTGIVGLGSRLGPGQMHQNAPGAWCLLGATATAAGSRASPGPIQGSRVDASKCMRLAGIQAKRDVPGTTSLHGTTCTRLAPTASTLLTD
ncbi:hypothetical protein PG990_011726 [Apiospora arundinis]